MGVALIMQGLTQYFMDAYGIYGASALAAAVVLRSISAAIFPEVVPIMYRNLGDAWACSIFAFLALACMPLPFLFFVSHAGSIQDASLDVVVTTEVRALDSKPFSLGAERCLTVFCRC